MKSNISWLASDLVFKRQVNFRQEKPILKRQLTMFDQGQELRLDKTKLLKTTHSAVWWIPNDVFAVLLFSLQASVLQRHILKAQLCLRNTIWSLSIFDETSSSPSPKGGAKQMSPPASTCKGSPCHKKVQVLTNVLHSHLKPMIDLGPDLEKPPEASYKKVTWSQVQKSHLKPGTKKSPEARPQICFRTVRQHRQSRNPCLSSLRCFVL